MSDVVENIGEQQNSAPSIEEPAQTTEAPAENVVTKKVEETAAAESAPASSEDTPGSSDKASVPADDVPEEDAGVEEIKAKPATVVKESSPVVVDNKKTPAKRTPSKRLSFIERAQKESEELVKNMGGSLEMEGGRRTRSSARGTPTRASAASTPPPAKKARTSPAGGAATPTRGRGRGRKLDTSVEGVAAEEEEAKPTPSKKKTPVKGKGKAATKEVEEEEEADAEDEDEPPAATEEENKKADEDSDAVKEKTGKAENVSKEKDGNETSAGTSEEKPSAEAGAEAESTITDSAAKSKDDSEELPKATSVENKPETKDAALAEDTPDAVLDPVVEETQSQVVASDSIAEDAIPKESDDVVLVQSESETNDSPMDSDDVELVENTDKDVHSQPSAAKQAEPLKEAEEPVVIPSKDTTPEPMEVDSSSNSNDVIEKMDDDVTIVETQPPEVVEKTQPASTQSEKAKPAAATNANTGSKNGGKVAGDVIKENSLGSAVKDAFVSPSSAVVVGNVVPANKLEAKPSSGEATNVAITNNDNKVENNTTPAANDTNKSENDLCEPKIATSPPISAANDKSAVTTTPQICN